MYNTTRYLKIIHTHEDSTMSLSNPIRHHIGLLVLIISSLMTVFLSGCNTTAGIGKDIEAAGDAIEDKAEEEKKY